MRSYGRPMRRLIPLFIAFFLVTPTAEAAWVWPVSGEVITPYRNGTDPYATGQHRGIDIAAPVGTPVVAAAGGEVRFAGTAGSSGLTIGIRTGDGYDTSYLHLSSLSVKAGAWVSTRDRIGAVRGRCPPGVTRRRRRRAAAVPDASGTPGRRRRTQPAPRPPRCPGPSA